jgi:hypothetical protein
MSRGSQFGVATVIDKPDKPDKAEFVFLDHAAKSPCPLCSSEEQVSRWLTMCRINIILVIHSSFLPH